MIGMGQALPTGRNLPVAAGLAGVVAVIVLGLLRLDGNAGFPTDPLGAVALAIAVVGAMLAASRLVVAGNRRAGRTARWLGACLLAYLFSAGWAVWAAATGNGSAPLAIACWSTAWIPPLGLMQVTASAAVRADERPPWTHRILTAVLGAATLLNPVLTTSGEPFTGLPTIAPESWQTTLAPLGAIVTLLGAVALLLIPGSLWRAALGSQGTARGRLGCAAAGATAAPLTVSFCLLLAVARDPGAVEPSLGSVAFLIALSVAALFSAACAVLAARGAVAPGHLASAVRGVGFVAAGLAVTGLGTIVASPGIGLGATPVAILVAMITLTAGVGIWHGTGRLISVLTPAPTTPARPAEAPHGPTRRVDTGPVPIPGLTAREAEVLAALAEGASNAGIAAQLVVSERTVDAHLRAIFVKLGLSPDAGTNRRVQAARIWLEHDNANQRSA
ncbi:helix-turn-helix transcriptional regulator [Luedemannella helvata]|uniref:HTH luxR-type domain-containing protein n=1 Tax=Luedemannella helvata TaxID=349315 RepID=A0ABP4W824_9ACTN